MPIMASKRLMVLGNARRPGVSEAAKRLLPWISQLATVVVVDLEQRVDLSQHDADFTLVLGGDGAILRAARQMGNRQLPVLGVNLGRLGFLADLSVDALQNWLPKVIQGDFRITRHLMFEMFEGPPPSSESRGRLVLNDVSIFNGAPFHMLDMDLLVDGAPASRYSADGLIVSTPVGSTAHSAHMPPWPGEPPFGRKRLPHAHYPPQFWKRTGSSGPRRPRNPYFEKRPLHHCPQSACAISVDQSAWSGFLQNFA